jgi:hypothetical protein
MYLPKESWAAKHLLNKGSETEDEKEIRES